MKTGPIPPVLLLAGALLVVAIVVEIARIALFSEGEHTTIAEKEIPLTSSAFKDVHTKFPKWKANQQQKYPVLEIPTFSHNIVENKHNNAIQLIIFTDHSSQTAREQEAYLLGLLSGTNKYLVQITYKFAPATENSTDGGLFEQIAYRAGVYGKYKRLLQERTGNLTGDDFVDILEKAGLPLAELRITMRRDMEMMLQWLEEDIQQARYLEATDVPTFFLNGHRLGTPDLPLHKVNSYVSNLSAGVDIWQK